MRNRIRWAIAGAALLFALPAAGAGKIVSGTIKSYECGDNCYLTIKTKDGKELTALCATEGCKTWNEQASMPRKFIGRRVQVTVGAGKQYDGSGTLMGNFPAFSKVVVGKKQGG